MPVHILAGVLMPPRGLRLGPLHFTTYGLSAALGLLASMGFARHCASRAGADPETIWDAGLFAIFSCFVASRLLLALESPAAFVRYPLLLMGLPSLTFGGMALAALACWLYLRWKQLPMLGMLDVFAAPAALLAAFLELGHWADGSDSGMPTHLPWGVAVDGTAGALRAHPVALYGVVLSLALAFWLWLALPHPRLVPEAQPNPSATGRVASLGLILGGMSAFALDMLSVPPVGIGHTWLEPGQWLALAVVLAGVLLWALRPLEMPYQDRRLNHSSPNPSPLHTEVH